MFHLETLQDEKESWMFQGAAVNKALCAVPYLSDTGMRVILDQDEKAGIDTWHILHKKSGKTTKMRRIKNVWSIVAFIDDEDETSSFMRQG